MATTNLTDPAGRSNLDAKTTAKNRSVIRRFSINTDKRKDLPDGSQTAITLARGDGIGPEIMEAVLRIIESAGAVLDVEEIEIGEKAYLRGVESGMDNEAWDSLRRTKVFLKSPITTPQRGGYKSLNVTARTMLGLYANVRPCRAYAPVIATKHPEMDLVIVRENEEDTYIGIEHQQTPEVAQCLKLITRPGCEKILRYAFEYARKHGRRKVTCTTKDNIMKLTDGMFHKIFDEVALDYPEIESDHWIIDIGAARLADTPDEFDVLVTLNLYGDILSDIASLISGSVGLGASLNIGERCAMFEAVHGSAPTIAGQNLANPSGLLLAAVAMLVHINQSESANLIHNAWLRTVEEGVHTGDLYEAGRSERLVGTKEFADAVIDRLGKKPDVLKPVEYAVDAPVPKHHQYEANVNPPKRELVGVDVFINWSEEGRNAEALGHAMERLNGDGLQLSLIANRGARVYPGGVPETFCTDQWRCRFVGDPVDRSVRVTKDQVLSLVRRMDDAGFDFIKVVNLYTFDGEIAFSVLQGE